MGYHRLALSERYRIEVLFQSGKSIRSIASSLRRSPSTVSRELRRLEGPYSAEAAEVHSALEKTRPLFKQRKVSRDVKRYVHQKLRQEWSPEQIAGRITCEKELEPVSAQTIYRYIYRDKERGGKLWKNLRVLRKQRKDRKQPQYGTYNHLVERRMIDERPQIVEKRVRVGDYERDTVFGKFNGSLLLTIVDRRSRLLKLAWLPKKTADGIHKATVELLKNEPVKTITNDNGGEFRRHKGTEKALGIKIYFSRAYRSWERGTNENLNGLLRQYFPKSKDIGTLTKSQVKRIENRLNNRPRKCLDYKTPREVHAELCQVLR